MFISTEELKTHAYDGEIKAIIREDETIAMTAIDVAVSFAKSKLMKAYDVEAVFSAIGEKRNTLLVKIIKDIAIWELIGLANPHIDYEDKKFRYQQAVSWLDAVYDGMPADLPTLPEVDKQNTSFSYNSREPRKNYY